MSPSWETTLSPSSWETALSPSWEIALSQSWETAFVVAELGEIALSLPSWETTVAKLRDCFVIVVKLELVLSRRRRGVRRGTQELGSLGFVSEPKGGICDEPVPGSPGFVLNPLGSATNPTPGFVSEPRGWVCDEPAPSLRQTKLLGSSQSLGVGFVVNPGAGFVSKPKRRVRREPSSWVCLRIEAEGIFGLGEKKMRKKMVSIFCLFL
ncbi:hypothetical protein SLEP1_g15230 [Rubroshorea leprosula]|uniref:Uncharacterized protein n=1 Tax=Rubroshorea leprosula TaxID=152421 RepID=A0AAV5ILP5_9ROSI|nr:hypothetical protein SLEP1_g15230 [Rubroshorea leprosula]